MNELERAFDFGKRSSYEAVENLARTRSQQYKRKKHEKSFELWNKPAPDLRMQLFQPSPPVRNSRDAIQPWKYKASHDFIQPVKRLYSEVSSGPKIREIISGAEQKQQEIIVPAYSLRPWEAKLLFVKEGMLPREVYITPKPHDFRGYPTMRSLGLPEFSAAYEKDPYNIHFKSKHLDQITGLQPPSREVLPGKQLGDDVLKHPPKWEKELHLPHEPFPNRAKETTRHRPLYRSPYSAFLERVEDKLCGQWQREKTTL